MASITYPATRKNIPPAGLEAQGEVRAKAAVRYEYNPHLPPALRSAADAGAADRLPELLEAARRRALTEDEAAALAEALRRHEPWLEWTGKRERPWFEVEPVALHMHERVSTQAILRVLARQDVQRDLFADPQLDYARAVQFYRHDIDWTNRMILGDSLQVMASLAHREDLAGKVQMIYVDPPYGIRFASNFQPQLGQRDVKDRQQDLTREPEMVKAYRDTWTLGVHSYLAYLRDRLTMARELLSDTGSIFVQISDENLHRVRLLMDEVFGVDNFVVTIKFSKTSGLGGRFLDETFDHLIWFAKDIEQIRFRRPFMERVSGEAGATQYRYSIDCRTVPHITLKSIARNVSLDPIFARHEPILAAALAALNRHLAAVTAETKRKLAEKLIAKHRRDGANAVTGADVRRWLLPDASPDLIVPVGARRPLKAVTARQAAKYREQIPDGEWREWEAPFDADPDWPQPLQQALAEYRAAWRAKMDEVNACIAANAETEELVDKPAIVKNTVRVAGPFTMEGVIALEEGPDTPIGGAPEELDRFGAEDGAAAAVNAEAHLDKMIRLLKASGVQFPANKKQRFERLGPVTGAALIHAEGEWRNGAGEARKVAVSIGPEAGNVTAWQVEEVVRDANRAGYDDVVFAGFGFDAAAQAAIEHAAHRNLRLHMALISPDAALDDLLKTQPGSQIFTVFSAPRVTVPTRREEGDYVVEVEGMDVYDPVTNTLAPTEAAGIAAWFLDTDYDGRTFCICQAFFPDKSKWSRLAKALGRTGLVEEAAFDDLSGLRSLPFAPPPDRRSGEPWRIAVKVIDPRGNEGLRVLAVEAPA